MIRLNPGLRDRIIKPQYIRYRQVAVYFTTSTNTHTHIKNHHGARDSRTSGT